MMPTISQLQYITAVDELKHFGKAAKRCHISQPSLSMQIQKVEEDIGFLIFDRNKKPVVPTAKGELFLEQAKRVLKEHEKLVYLCRVNFNELVGEFRLGIIPTLISYVLPHFLEHFTRTYPKVELKVDELTTEEIISQLRSDKLDAGILATPLSERGIREHPLFYEEFFAYVHPSHPLFANKVLRTDQIDTEGLWLLKDGHCFRNQVVNLCSKDPSSGNFQNFSFEGGSLETLRLLVRDCGGYTLVPALFAASLPEAESKSYLRRFEQPAPLREVSLAFSRTQWKRDITQALEDSIRHHLPKGVFENPPQNAEVIAIK